MRGNWVTVTVCLLLITLQVARLNASKSKCSTSGPRMQCGDAKSNENRNECVKNPRCCWLPGPTKPNCYVNMGSGSLQAEMKRAKSVLGSPPSRQISNRPLQMAARKLNVSASERTRLEGRAGRFNMQNTAAAMVFGFPKCPLDVPVCQRVRCQPYNLLSESNPNECYKDPRCCFDADLFVHKYILGSSFLGDAPVCFMGPTSLRFVEITNMIQPWSPFYLQPVVDIFERYLDLQLDFQQARQCLTSNIFDIDLFRTPKCGWEGITKLECNLKGCCYNTKTSNCAYPRHLFQQAGGRIMRTDVQQFPELFESKTTQCVKDGIVVDRFEVFKRLPCAQPSASTGSTTSDFLNLFRTCPSSCCKNLMALLPGINDLSNGGRPSRYALSNSPYATYLTNPLISQAVVNLFCPYYYVKFPGLGDLTDSVRGCCKQTTCYHKSLQSTGPVTTASWTTWTTWTSCNAPCRQQGEQSRERQCVIIGTNTRQASSMCGGGPSYESRTCYGKCGTINYGWAQWGQWSACEGLCGSQGIRRRYRSCPSGRSCPGSAVQSISCQNVACPCQWTAWSPAGPCSVTCGSGGTRSYSRQCLAQGTPCSQEKCPGGPRKTAACAGTLPSCTRYAYGELSGWSRCNSNCEHTRYKLCQNIDTGVVVNSQNCLSTGKHSESESCKTGECVPDQSWVSWGAWSQWTECASGRQIRTRYRTCYYLGRASSPIGDSICAFVHNTNPTEEQSCYYGPQVTTGSSSYSWADWSAWSMCSESCGAGQQSRTRSCVNDRTKQRTSNTRLCGSTFSGIQFKNCYSSSFWCISGLLT